MYVSELLLWLVCVFFILFFFKQKTAYEMRISDWSSDVCSSDLTVAALRDGTSPRLSPSSGRTEIPERQKHHGLSYRRRGRDGQCRARSSRHSRRARIPHRRARRCRLVAQPGRSEEHSSELQSLMRISYSVFCLQKKHTTLLIT